MIMSEENERDTETNETAAAKPTITIAERKDEAAKSDAKPTITIAEKKGD